MHVLDGARLLPVPPHQVRGFEVLTFVLKEYVVEGPPPMLVHQAETLSDLKGASFATLISALQIRFEHPELAMFGTECFYILANRKSGFEASEGSLSARCLAQARIRFGMVGI